MLAKLRSKGLILIDDFGLAPIASRGSRELLDILDERIGAGSTIIASQLPVGAWYQSFPDSHRRCGPNSGALQFTRWSQDDSEH